MIFDLSVRHQLQKRILIDSPIPLVAFERFEDVICRRQKGLVDIFSSAKLPEKIGEVACLGEASQLRRVVQADVDYCLSAGLTNPVKKVRSICFCETNRCDVYLVQMYYSAATVQSVSIFGSA